MNNPSPPQSAFLTTLTVTTAIIGFGSFGVPLKDPNISAHPFVLQTYKSALCFLTSFVVLLYPNDSSTNESFLHIDPLGLISGLLWVSGGVGGIFGIRNAGIAISVGTWSAVTVLISFGFGMGLFGERVVSLDFTIMGIGIMLTGFAGMTYFSSPKKEENNIHNNNHHHHEGINIIMEDNENGGAEKSNILLGQHHLELEQSISSLASSEMNPQDLNEPLLLTHHHQNNTSESSSEQDDLADVHVPSSASDVTDIIKNGGEDHDVTDDDQDHSEYVSFQDLEEEQQDQLNSSIYSKQEEEEVPVQRRKENDKYIELFGRQWSRRVVGILAAASDGVLGGGNLVPMHYSKYEGLGYVISFAFGAAVVTLLGWLLLFLQNYHKSKCIQTSYNDLPAMQIRTLWKQGTLAGFLWSMANIGQILSVSSLGESIGMSLIQSQMLVSGIWGIVWFQEITGWRDIGGWILSALLTLLGVVLLSWEHKAA